MKAEVREAYSIWVCFFSMLKNIIDIVKMVM